MIQKMKKLTFLIFYKEYDQFLQSLQNLGVMHIQESADQSTATQLQSSDEIREKEEQIKTVQRVIDALGKIEGVQQNTSSNGNPVNALQHIVQYDSIIDAIRANKSELQRYQKDYDILMPWGTFDRALVASLEEKGIKLSFYQAPAAFFKKYPEYAEGEVSRIGKNVYFVNYDLADSEDVVPATQVQLPEETLEDCVQHINDLTEQIQNLEEQKIELAIDHMADIKAYEQQLIDELAVLKAQYATAVVADNKIMVLEGWYPEVNEQEIQQFLQAENKYYEVREPNDTDDVPIKLKNNWFARQFEVLTGMYGMPSYNEWDPTPVLSLFYSLFFAICMGDCGYGILLILFGWGVKADKIKGGLLDMFSGLGNIIMILGVATTIVGFFLGTCMGANMYECANTPEAAKALMAPFQGEIAGYSTQMVMALVIGVFHICLAMTLKAIIFTKKSGLMANLSTWGWLLLILGSIVSAILLGVNVIDEQTMKWVLIGIGAVSALGIYIFNDIHRNPLINVGAGLYDTYNMASGLLGDVLSYVRLYALGLSGGMLGATFNTLGLQLIEGDKPVWMLALCGIGTVLILVLGHVLNIAMAALGAFVHPLRLTFVEYFKNVGYEGKGTKYSPFKKVI